MKRIYIVRHGQTFINHYNKMQGWCDTPLTDEGIKGAEMAGETLKNVPFDIALSSDLKRASDTCELIMKHNCNRDILQHLASPFFREQFYGYFEGMDTEMAWRMIGGPHGYDDRHELLRKEPIDTIKNWIKEADPYHEAENAQEYWARLDKGFKLIKELDGAENILLVTHGFTIRSIADHFGENIDVSSGPRNASITMLLMDNKGQMKVTSYNKMQL
ncbi:histidine phosphatase family protein [Lactobacillus gigeriorum]|uniref:Phosphoglycerate mutase n=1 Tax=Lactobacillus gigeriorum DSM 23908 = CRBIP 24.85 TaxID=1423751 RepID=I7KNR5_9LACO|nr:histidine phosphatase family protein [Lactobacillus gigeriorum]KRN12255.1 phosphoglycerate mutase [Lactobacillus gigeriorum DSM 23908 = CRBIP 24.85]CCI86899.1 Phosphoglycerate mutase [Lactobacillus gigeriorum DSM 23908 = CRBIP 24.85]